MMKLSFLSIMLLVFSFNIKAQSCWKIVKSGDEHTVGIKNDGTLWAWGHNDWYQLGTNSVANKLEPFQISTDNNWQTVSVGGSHTLALKNDGTLWGWGNNALGQVGVGSTDIEFVKVPTQIGTAKDWRQIVAGSLCSFGIKADGTLWAWGNNTYAEFGDGTQVNKVAPTKLGTDNDWAFISEGDFHFLAIKTNGTLWAWGLDEYGEVGDGKEGQNNVRLTPFQVGTATDWQSAVSKGSYSLAVKKDGTLWAWGQNQYGQLGDGTVLNQKIPTQVGTDNTWQNIASGGIFNLAVKKDGTLWGWGFTQFGQLGDGTTATKLKPAQLAAGTNWSKVAAGIKSSFIIKTDGRLWVSGVNNFGQLGDGTTSDNSTFQSITCPTSKVTGVNDIKSLTTESVQIFPNPTYGMVKIVFSNNLKNAQMTVTNAINQVIKKQLIRNSETSIDISTYPPGLYFVNIQSDNGILITKKLEKM